MDLNTEVSYIHDKCREFLAAGEFHQLNKFMEHYLLPETDMAILKTLLIITKGYKDHKVVGPTRYKLLRVIEKKFGTKLI